MNCLGTSSDTKANFGVLAKCCKFELIYKKIFRVKEHSFCAAAELLFLRDEGALRGKQLTSERAEQRFQHFELKIESRQKRVFNRDA